MTNEMRVLLESLVNTAKAQKRQLNLQIEDYETLLREAGLPRLWRDVSSKETP